MKRAHDQAESDPNKDAVPEPPPAKKPRVEAEPKPFLFLALEGDKTRHVITWTPPNEEMAGVMRSIFSAYGKKATSGADLSEDDMFAFDYVLGWLAAEEPMAEGETPPPLVTATGKTRADFGELMVSNVDDLVAGTVHEGPVFYYASWH
jgi:hypothetical protein